MTEAASPQTEVLSGYVAKLLTDEELILNIGTDDGVAIGMVFEILDPRTRDIEDPITHEPLGSMDRVIANVGVTQLERRICIARRRPRRKSSLSQLANVFADVPERDATLTGDRWPEGVRVGYPVRIKTEPSYE